MKTRARVATIADVVSALIAGITPAASIVGWWIIFRFRRPRKRRTALVLDPSYSLALMKERDLLHVITNRDLGGFFDHVWTVHPLIGASPEHESDKWGAVRTVDVANRHTVIEGFIGFTPRLRRLPLLNFVLAQGRLLRFLCRTVARNGIAVVQVGEPYYQALIGLILARVAQVPLIIRVAANFDAIYDMAGQAAYPRLFRTRSLEKSIERHTLRRAALIVAANENNREFAIRNGAPLERTVVLSYGNVLHPAHLTEPATRSRVQPWTEARRFIICIGRLEPEKYPEDVLAAFIALRSRHRDVGLVFVGDGSLGPQLKASTGQAGVESEVYFAGYRNQRWIANATATATVIASPLTGRALVEALLSGTAVVAYDTEWHSEVVHHGDTGLLVPFRDVGALGEAISRLLDTPDDAREIGTRGRASALAFADPDQVREAQRSAYRRVLYPEGPQ